MSTKDGISSQDEQDLQLGRATREYGELRDSLENIDVELKALADGLEKLVGFVNGRVRLTQKPPDAKLPEFPESVSKYIDASKLKDLLKEQDRLLKPIRAANKF